MGTHIAKIKSVNLDLWPTGKVEIYAELNNNLVNSYWEANLPPGFMKPSGNAPNAEVVRYLTDKYVTKKYVDGKMKHDPLWLCENRPSKFQRFLKKRMQGESDSEEEPQPVKEIKQAPKAVAQSKVDVKPL
jgi:hypothetical protein